MCVCVFLLLEFGVYSKGFCDVFFDLGSVYCIILS